MRTEATTRAIYFMIILMIIFIIGFVMSKNTSVKWTSLLMGFIFLLITINLIFLTMKNEIVDEKILNLFDLISAASFYFYWFAAGMIFIIWVVTIFNTFQTEFGNKNYDKYNFGGKYE